MAGNNKSKSSNADNAKSGTETASEETAQANAEAMAEAEKIKADAIAEAEKIVADANQVLANAQTEATEIENDAKGEAGDIVADAQKDAQAIAEQSQRDRDDKSRGAIAEDADLQPFRNVTARTNVFTERGRCRPNETIMLTVDEGQGHKGLEQCRASE